MTEFALPDLKRIIESSSGAVADMDWEDPKTLDTFFDDIGYDSLALLEMCAVVRREYGVTIPDEAVFKMQTPAAAITYINDRLKVGGKSEMPGHTDNSVVIDAPMSLVWKVTNDLEMWPILFAEYASTEVIDGPEGVVRFRLTMHPDAQGRTWSWVSERELDEIGRTVRARRVETGVFKYMNLFWEYLQTPDGVRMRWVQDFELKPDAHIDNIGMAEHLDKTTQANQNHIKQFIEKAAGRVELHG